MNEYKEYINSEDLKQGRERIIEERGNQCEKCGAELSKNKLRLHHKNYDMEFGKEKDGDLKILCEDCHNEAHQDVEFFDQKKSRFKAILNDGTVIGWDDRK